MPTFLKHIGKHERSAVPTLPTPPSAEEKDAEKAETDVNPKLRERASSTTQSHTERDKYVVDWEGPDDPQKPTNWSPKKKWKNLLIVNTITLITPLASSMFAPGVPRLMKDFHSTNVELASFVVSIYILGFAFGPLVIAPMCELYGRRKLYQICNLLFLVCNVACGEAPNIGFFLAFRFLAGCAGVAPLTIGAGSIADLMVPEQRGSAMALFSLGPLLGPIIGPIAGGYVSEGPGWRWVFRILTIASGIVAALTLLLNETYPHTLLASKAARLRKEHKDPAYKSILTSTLSPKVLFQHALIRPLKMLFLSPIVALLSLHMALIYGLLYLLFTTFAMVFQGVYNFSTGSSGLTFLGLGVGCIIGVVVIGFSSDKIFVYLSKKHGAEKPEFRLPIMVFSCLMVPLGMFWYGWSAQAHVHYMVPIVGTGFVAFGMMSVMLPIQNYLVDAYTQYAASAVATTTILRSILGALLPLAGQPMYEKLGIGWGNSLLGFLALAMAPVPFIFWRHGEHIRKRWPVELE